MRPIIFRAKRTGSGINAGKWVHGSLIHSLNGVFMYGYQARCQVPVDPATIGQFTGLHDRFGSEIYEGDIVQWGDSEHKIKQVVEFRNGAFGYVYDSIGSFVPYAANTNFDFAALGTDKRFEVVGNIHDNPELLEINKRTNDEQAKS